RNGRRLLPRRLALRDGTRDRREERRVEVGRPLVGRRAGAAPESGERRFPPLAHGVPRPASVADGLLKLLDRGELLLHDVRRLLCRLRGLDRRLAAVLPRWTAATSWC